jgi:hypothetical protein
MVKVCLKIHICPIIRHGGSSINACAELFGFLHAHSHTCLDWCWRAALLPRLVGVATALLNLQSGPFFLMRRNRPKQQSAAETTQKACREVTATQDGRAFSCIEIPMFSPTLLKQRGWDQHIREAFHCLLVSSTT